MPKRSPAPADGHRPRRPQSGSGAARPAPADGAAPSARAAGTVVRLTPDHILLRASRRFLQAPASRCTKCGSEFVTREPAFLHCHYCGAMTRIANASLEAQEVFEIRSGLRLAS
ncbi:MAG TPA: hypothetical protein VFX28_06135 [Methylomirabilota bacterium]|nr:hypothetical protein [Methylomirabilota bacterium]